jgi:TPR repeat protein
LGYGTDKDLEKACNHFSKKYSDKPHSFSVKSLLDLEHGLGSSEKRDTLTEFEENNALLKQIEDKDQLFELGMYFFDWEHIPGKRIFSKYIVDEEHFMEIDYSRAFKCIEKAANKKHPNAIVQLGIMYRCGYGVERDDRTGEKYFNGAVLVDNEITNYIPLLYHTHEAMQNFSLAKKWYTRLQRAYIKQINLTGASKPAQIGLGLLYEFGDGEQKKLSKRIGLLCEAC